MATGEVPVAIVETAQEVAADLIMMPSHRFTFYQLPLGTVTTKVLMGTECPVWTGAHVEVSPRREFAIRNVLCEVEFGPRAKIIVSWSAQLAAEFGARLTLADVTAGVKLWGPGGNYFDQGWKEELVRNASEHMARLRQDIRVKAEVFIGSGDVSEVVRNADQQTNADLLVTGCYPHGVHLRTHGYAIICAVPIPVLSV